MLLALAASVAINTLLFLWIALLSDCYTSTAELRYTRVSGDVHIIENTVWMRERYRAPPNRPFNVAIPVPLGIERSRYVLTDDVMTTATESTFLRDVFENAEGRYLHAVTTIFEAGLPLRCFRSASRFDYAGSVPAITNLGYTPIPASIARATQFSRTNQTWPSTILWPRLALNLLFWGACAWGAMAAWTAARVRVRRFRARHIPDPCPACSYPLGGLSVCPECGTAATDDAGSTPTPPASSSAGARGGSAARTGAPRPAPAGRA